MSESDIALGRLAQVAAALDLDVASLVRNSKPEETPRTIELETSEGSRGHGVNFAAFRVQEMQLELIVAAFPPRTAFANVATPPAIDVLHITDGELVLAVDGKGHVLGRGRCLVPPSRRTHTVRNDSDRPAVAVGFSTETLARRS